MVNFIASIRNRIPQRIQFALGLTTILTLTTLALAHLVPPAIDWTTAFRLAPLEMLAGRSPYNVPGGLYVYPPWVAMLLVPLAVLPEPYARAAFLLVSIGVLFYTSMRLGANRTTSILFLISPPVVHGLINGNIDWLVLVGFVLPPWIGLFFISIKPQIGLTVALFWLVEIWRKKGFTKVVKTFWPISTAFALSFLIFGLWPLGFDIAFAEPNNASLWPVSIPVGLILMIVAFKRRDRAFAMGAAPCLSPFLNFHSWSGALAALLPHTAEMLAAVIGLWIVIAIQIAGVYANSF